MAGLATILSPLLIDEPKSFLKMEESSKKFNFDLPSEKSRTAIACPCTTLFVLLNFLGEENLG